MIKHDLLLTPWKKEIKNYWRNQRKKRTKTTTLGDSKKNNVLQKFKDENTILFRDLNSIQDPNVRAYIHSEQNQILVERSEQQQPQQPLHLDNILTVLVDLEMVYQIIKCQFMMC